MSKKSSETVKVCIRVRPMNAVEKKNNSVGCVTIDKYNNTVTICKPDTPNDPKTFQFDSVYDPTSTQRSVYDEVAFPMVESVFEGYNGTIFAYGQTGCGKTFTMMGDVSKTELMGIIPNSFNHIFGYISTEGASKKFLVRCSFIEIYQEEIKDLLGNPKNKLDIREDPKLGIFVKDLSTTQVGSSAELEKALLTGNKNKHVGETTMNADSSRSHSIFTIYVEMMDESNTKNKIKAGKLNLVDLAGSERQSKTNATGMRMEEAKKINLSLTALSNVINALVDKKSHVPYRDSKLTRLLQDSLGGNTKTYMIAAVSPASFNFDESLSTLRYAARANSIKNAPTINEDPKDAELRRLHEEIRKLKELLESKPGVMMNSNNYSKQDAEDYSKNKNYDNDSRPASGKKKESESEEDSEDEESESESESEEDPKDKKGKETQQKVVQKSQPLPATVTKKPADEGEQYVFDEKDKDYVYAKQEEKLKRLKTQKVEDMKEKDALLQKLKELEKNMFVGGKIEKLGEQEKNKFKEYRAQQLKNKEEQKKKKQILEEKKKEDEELLTQEKQYNDIQVELKDKNKIIEKLKEKNKFLDSEIRDLKYENERDKEDMVFSIKELNKENKLYYGILRVILTENEIKKIINISNWNEDKEEWRIHPFSIQQRKGEEAAIKFPNLKPFQYNDFIENEIQNRDFAIGDISDNNPRDLNENDIEKLKGSKQDKKELMEGKNGKLELRMPTQIKNNSRYEETGNERKMPKNSSLESQIARKKIENTNSMIAVNKFEQKRIEELLKNTPRNFINEIGNNIKNKAGKVVLEPLGTPDLVNTKNKFYNNTKKMEVSFKATFKITDDQIYEEPKKKGNKKLAKLTRIPELKDQRESPEHEDS